MFLRVHRSHLVNLERVDDLRCEGQSRWLVLANSQTLAVIQPHWEQLKTALLGCEWAGFG